MSMIMILVSGAVASTGVWVENLWGEIVEETEKAVKIRLDYGSLWLPKKALLTVDDEPNIFKLAKWFKFSSVQNTIVVRNSRVVGVCDNRASWEK